MFRSKFNERFVLWVLWAGSCSSQWFLESSTKVLWHFTVIHHYLKQSKLALQIQFLSWMCLCRAHVLWMKWFVFLITASHPFPPVWHADKHSPSGICSFYPPLPCFFQLSLLVCCAQLFRILLLLLPLLLVLFFSPLPRLSCPSSSALFHFSLPASRQYASRWLSAQVKNIAAEVDWWA